MMRTSQDGTLAQVKLLAMLSGVGPPQGAPMMGNTGGPDPLMQPGQQPTMQGGPTGPQEQGPEGTDRTAWHHMPLWQRLAMLQSGEGLPSFIDPGSVAGRIDYLQRHTQEPGVQRPGRSPEMMGGGGASSGMADPGLFAMLLEGLLRGQ